MTEGKREKCQFCENCDLDGHCLAKENYDFFECENDEHFEPIEEYELARSNYVSRED